MRNGREWDELLKDQSKFLEVLSSITSAISDSARHIGNTTLVTIDGPAGSGKTTLAKRIGDHFATTSFSFEVIHTDDLYNGWDDALGESLTKTFSDFLLPGLQSGQAYSLPQFDWIIHEFSQPTLHSPTDLVIVEGVGAGQAVMRAQAAFSIWIEVSEEIGLIRVLNRDGASIRKQMHNFQIAQREHFACQKTKESADFFFDGAP